MSFEDDVMANAVDIQNTAIYVALKQQDDQADEHYAATSGPELYFQDLANGFRPHSQIPDPAVYGPMIEDLRQVLRRLSNGGQSRDPVELDTYLANSNLDDISASAVFIDKWHGGAAQAFDDSFITPFPAIVRNQFIITATIRSALIAYQYLWQCARNDILEIQKQTLAALDSGHCCGQDDWQIFFTVLEAVATIAAVPVDVFDAPLGVALTVAAVGATSGAAANWPHDSDPPQHNSSKLAWQVVQDMNTALDRVRREIAASEQKITSTLDHNNAYIDANLRSFINPRPQLAGATAATITQYMGFAS
jgi:hypothetical protein